MTSPWTRRPPGDRRLGEDVERLEGDRPVRLGVVVDVDPPDVRLALVPVEPVDVELDRLVEVDRVLVDEGLGAEQVDLADDPRPVRRRVDDHDVLLGGRPERDLRGREVLARPVPAPVAGLPDVALLGEEGEEVVGRAGTEDLARLERQLEGRRPCRWASRTWRLSGSSRASSGGPVEEELRVVHHVAIDRRAGRDQDPDADALAPAGPADLLPGRGDRARIAGEDRHVEPSDVDAELERVRADDPEDLAVAQPALDRAALRGQVAAAVAADPGARPGALAERLAEAGQEQLDRRPRPAEDDRLAAGPEEGQGPAVGGGERGATGAGRRIEERRLDQQDVALAATARRSGRRGGPAARSGWPPARPGCRSWPSSTRRSGASRSGRTAGAAGAGRWPRGCRRRPGRCAARR